MAYQVVARKWRPQRFDEVIGQDHVTSTLKYAILNKRIAPVYLFTGIRGTGKTTLARIWVKAINCLDIQPDGEPCNKCECCREILEGKSPDVIEIDGASTNSVDDVRNIIENISYLPVKSKYKVYIIDEVHMLSKPAFNALLKTLEEPPAHTVFILATTDPQKIPTTVLSRCQRYDLKRLSLDDVAKQLAKIVESEKCEYDMDALYAIAREGEGSMRDSQTVLEQLMTFGGGKVTESEVSKILGTSDKHLLRTMIESIAKHDSAAALSAAREMYNSGKSIEKAARDIMLMLHHIVLFSELGNTDFLEAPAEEKEWVKQCAALASAPDWTRFFRFWAGEYDSIKSSDFSLMIFEVAVITACGFPLMKDFRSFAKSIADGTLSVTQAAPAEKKTPDIAANIPKPAAFEAVKPAEQPAAPEMPRSVTRPAAVSRQKADDEAYGAYLSQNGESADDELKHDSWTAFVNSFKERDIFFSSALRSLPYKEESSLITVSIDMGLEFARTKLNERLKKEFALYFGNRKELSIVFEKGDNVSIYTEEELAHLADIEKRKENMRQSEAVKAAAELGFELKGVSAE